jgi:predicted metal-binding transcription factor (methanogenesis marker protein 9)
LPASIQYEPPFSNLQMELLRLFDKNLSEAELLEVKKLLANHFLEKAMDAADKVWEKNNWTEADANRMMQEHHRTPYKAD